MTDFNSSYSDNGFSEFDNDTSTHPAEEATHVIVIDTTVDDYESLVANAPSGAEIILLDGSEGFAGLALALEGYEGVETLEILSHGDTGEVILGSETLSLDTMGDHSAALNAIKTAMASGGDLLLYGCNVGEGGEGIAFVNAVAAATGADVAASDDLTGSEALGGDWSLEYSTGDILTAGTFSAINPEFANILGPSPGTIAFTNEGDLAGVTGTGGAIQDPSATNVGGTGLDAALFTTGGNGGVISMADGGRFGEAVAGAGDPTLHFLVDSGSSTALDYISISSTDGAEFQIDSMVFGSYSPLGSVSITLTGWRDNAQVATMTFSSTTYTTGSSSDGNKTVTFDADWENIDEIRVTATGADIAAVGVDDLVISAAVAGNTAPSITLPTAPTVSEDDTNVAIANDIQITDGESDNQTVTLTITGGTASLTTTGLSFTTGDGNDDSSMVFSGTLSAINTALDSLTFTPTADLNGTNAGSIQIQTDDGNGGNDDQTVTFNIGAVNDAPVLDNSDSPQITVLEDAGDDDGSGADGDDDASDNTNNGGDTVASIVTNGSITDADGSAVESIAITYVDNTNGMWQYSLDDGANWTSLGISGTTTSMDTFALLLRSTDLIRFVPDADYSNGSADFYYRAWDETTGTAGTTADTTTNGGTTPFSSASEIATVNVLAVNDAPVFSNLDDTPTFTEDGSVVQLDANVGITDADLDIFNSGNGNYSGASLTIVRNGGASADDALSVVTSGSLTVTGGPNGGGTITSGGNTIATISNAGDDDELTITFADNGTTPTRALVNEVMQAIRYSNSSDTPDASVQLDWTFSDGNSADAQGSGDNPGTASGSVTVSITATNDAPTVSGIVSDISFAEETAGNVDLSAATFSDVDSSSITVTLSIDDGAFSAPADGSGTGSGVTATLVNSTTITLVGSPTDINTYLDTTDNIQYTGSTDTTGDNSATLTVTANDGDGSGDVSLGTANIDITAVNDAPAFTGLDGTPSFTEDGSAVVFDSNVTISDQELDNGGDFGGASLTIARNGGADASDTYGFDTLGASFTVSGSNLQSGGQTFATFSDSNGTLTITFTSSATTATPALVDDVLQRITYQNTSDAPASSVQLDWTFSDGNLGNAQGTGDNPATATGSVTVSITGVNDAPVVDDTQSPTLTGISEDPSTNNGSTVTSIVNGSISDPDGSAVDAIAVTAVDNTNGTWQFSTNAGVDWTPIDSSTTNDSNALLLDSTHMLRFVPGTNYNGSSTITFRAWDKTTGVAGTFDDASTNGGTTAFSSATDTASITVTAVNDVPAFSNLDDTPTFTEGGSVVQLDANVAISDSELGSLNGGSGDFSGATLTIARNGGVSTNDSLSVVSGGTLTVAGSPNGGGTITSGGNTIANISNAGDDDELTITFVNTGTTPTTALVNEVLRAVRYSNSSDNPDASVQLDWTFSDGNSADAQGSGDNPGTGSGSITVSITGVNDAATIAGDLTGSMNEDTDTLGGTATASDPDNNNDTFIADTIVGTYGNLDIAANGDWVYDLNEANSDVQGLLNSDTLQDTLTISSEDGTTEDIVITIGGLNDDATFGGNLTGSLNEDTDTLGGTATVADVDAGQGTFTANTIAGTYGNLDIAANGDWVYDLNEANSDVQGLAASDTLKDTITVTSDDGTTQDIVITVTGVNDAATFGGDLTGSLNEDTDTLGGTATVADVDAGQGTFTADTIAGTYGNLDIAANGDWVYDLNEANSDVQGLLNGDTLKDTITVASDDGTTQDIVITIGGLNDDATFGGDLTGSLNEDTDTLGGTATVSDVDAGEGNFDADTITGTYGDLAIAANGDWVYDLNEANSDVQGLLNGDTLKDTITVASDDGTTQDIVITIGGLNDDATFGGDLTGSLNEDTDTLGGTATVADVDAGEGTFTANTIAGTYGNLDIAANGDWVYDLNEANSDVQGLAASDTLKDTITVTSDDGTTQDIVITVTGVNDAATIAGDLTGSLNEDTDTLGGTATVADVDAGEGTFDADTITGTYGDLTIAANGDWVYDLNEANSDVQGLLNGDTLKDTITVASTDGTTEDIVITIGGLNDDATFGGNLSGSLNEDTDTLGGTATVADVDNGEGTFDADTITGTYGDLTIATNGDWVYDLNEANSDVQGLLNGDTLKDTITVASDDGTTQDIVITVTGLNDDATFGGDLTGSLNEDTDTLGGTATVADVDAGEGTFTADTITGTYGDLTIAANGDWVYDLNEANSDVQGLSASDTLKDTITVTSDDGTTQDIVITVTGLDDAATFGGNLTGSLNEDTDTVGGTATVADVDNGEGNFDADTITGTYGDLAIAANGDWVYDLNEANSDVQGLQAGDTLQDTITVASDDGTTEDIVITIGGLNDLPTSSGGSVSTAEDTSKTFAEADFNFSDADTADTLASIRIDTLPARGTLKLSGVAVNAGDVIAVGDIGNLTYTPPLNATGATSFTYTVNDGTGFATSTATMSVAISARNDAPRNLTLSGDQTVIEEMAGSVIGTVSASDVDDTVLTYTVSDARFIITADNVLKLKPGQSIDFEAEETLTVTLTASDDSGASTSEDFTITVIDRNELPSSNLPDTITGGATDDLVFAVGGDDHVSTGDGRDTIDGGDGNDDIDGGGDDDFLIGGSGHDNLNAGSGNDLVYAGRGDDGNDTVRGSGGHDSLGGGFGDDKLEGEDNDDLLWGRLGNDTVDGGSGDDMLYNGEGDDTVIGGTGDDTLWAGADDDLLSGGDGEDTFMFGATSGNDTITDFSLTDDILNVQYSGAGFTALADVQAAASNTTVDDSSGLLIDLGNGQSVFLIGLSTDDLASMTIIL